MSVTIEDFNRESWFKISDSDSLRPFFINVVSDSNHWMFISSNGGITAGRKNPEYALFPYYTDDKISELAHTTGSKTIFRVVVDNSVKIWEPFSERYVDSYNISRNLYKNQYGNKIMFEEINHDFGLIFRYQWNSSNLYGFVKRAYVVNTTVYSYRISILDGLQNIMPYGVSSELQIRSSNLVDAYKRSELVEETGLGIYALSAIIVDKAEPSEALKANVVWSMGLNNPTYLLSSLQLDRFRKQKPLKPEVDVKGEKGAYFVQSEIELGADSDTNWSIVANVNLNHAHIIELNESIKNNPELGARVKQDIDYGTQNLVELVAGADGLKKTADPLRDTRHYSNVLFNIMRGGTFDHNYQIEKKDFVDYLKKASSYAFERNQSLIDGLSEQFNKVWLDTLLSKCDDPDLLRLCKEYLPLKFSRRHGDPSRPWNNFSINTHSELDGSKILDYEGNWRDIFQNWEALAHSYPGFVEGMIFKFLNASTFDGYNPYRVTKDGFDWETIEPDNPWSYIGYWGDHQIIYLLKFLEFYSKCDPQVLYKLLNKAVFVYANVPYRIKSYKDIVKDPKNTIEFDDQLDQAIREKKADKGADGALLENHMDEIHHVNFLEKILATVLAKVSNFIPEAGIWMNTQRPEWNDANNALVGNGVSMVTLYYLRRFLRFMEPLLEQAEVKDVSVSQELYEYFVSVSDVLKSHRHVLSGKIDDTARKHITDALGQAGGVFRNENYDRGFRGKKSQLQLTQVTDFVHIALDFAEHTIRANKRDDDLYHAYNLMSINENGIVISPLDEMLEGQVAVLSSGYLRADEALKLLDDLRSSSLYREDQQSYILYPNKALPGFMQKNTIPEESVRKSDLLLKLAADQNRQIIEQDTLGGYHFNGNFKNARDLKKALEELKFTNYASLVEAEEQTVLQIFEDVFNHKAFTGRSGSFFGYEGLGSIYWHMVSKLHLAVMEVCLQAVDEQADEETFRRLAAHFGEIGEGIGVHKSPELYGAFPIDPYSHTPQNRGAQQPGMTGQVKEDILVSLNKLGVFVDNGKLKFKPFLLKKVEFTKESTVFSMIRPDKKPHSLTLPDNALAFTYCQVPVVYTVAEHDAMEVDFSDGSTKSYDTTVLDAETTQHVFQRTGKVTQITVTLAEKRLR